MIPINYLHSIREVTIDLIPDGLVAIVAEDHFLCLVYLAMTTHGPK